MAGSDDLLNQWKQERTLTLDTVGNVNKPTGSDALIETWKTNQSQNFAISVQNAVKIDPNNAADIQRIAKELSLPTDTVERNKADLDAFIKSRRLEMAVLARDNPVLAQQYANPDFAAVAHDDYNNLSRTERVMRWFKEIPQDAAKGWQVGRLQSEQGLLGEQAMVGKADEAMWKRIKEINAQTKELKGTGGFVESASKILGQMSVTMPKAIEYGEATALTTGTAALIAGQVGPQVAVPEEIITVPAATIGGFIAGSTAKMAEQSYRIEAGQAYLDMIEQGINKDIARNVSAGVGLVNAGLEVVGIGFVTAPIKKALIAEVTQEVSKSLMKPTVKQAVAEFGKNYGKAWAAETSTEILQEISNIAGEEIAGAMSKDDFKSKMSTPEGRSEIAQRLAGVFEEVGKGMALLAIPGAGLNFRGDYKRAKEAQRQEEFFTELTSASTDSELRKRSPDAFHNLISMQAAESGVDNIYVDGAKFAQSMVEAGVSVEDIKRLLPDVASQIETAKAAGVDVVIPTADYATHIAPSDFGKALLQHARADAEAMSASDLKDFEQQKRDFMKDAANVALEKNAANEEFGKSAKEVENLMFVQLKDTKKFTDNVARMNAQFVRDFVVTQAARQNILPTDYYNKYMYKVRTEGAAAFSQESLNDAADIITQSPEFQQWFGASTLKGEDGKPLVLYHGTSDTVDQFDFDHPSRKDSGWLGTGVYLTDSTDMADLYAMQKRRAGKAGENVMPLYARLENPYYATAEDKAAVKAGGREAADAFTAKLKAEGYDGVVYQVAPDAKEIVVFDNKAVKSIFNKGTWSRETANLLRQSLSTRLPSAVKATEDPLGETLNINFDVTLSDPVTLEKNIKVLQETPNFRKLKGKGSKDPAVNAEAFINHVVENLLMLHDAFPAEMRERAELWYDGGRKTVEAWANRYGISEMQGAAAIAVLSPQNGWFPNVSAAERVADIVFGMRDFAWDDAMTEEAKRITKGEPDAKMEEAAGKTLGELLGNPDLAARWVRVYDQTYNNRAYRILTPEGGAADYAKTNSGKDATMAWKSYATIAKAISIYTDGRAENVYYQLGREHKVRNFYNNLFAPNSDLGFTTIDTHAVAAALLRPLAASDTEVIQAFGSAGAGSSSVTGLNGTYPLYLEAYRRAAEARGILPRQMQSVTWEAVRGLFEAAKKSGLKEDANAIWERYKKGEIEQAQAQAEIMAMAGGITAPSWSKVPFNDTVTRTYEGPAQAAIDAAGDKGAAFTDTNPRVFFEVAPDPNDKALTEQWNALPDEEKSRISQQIATQIVPKVLEEVGTSGEFTMQIGGYMGATNPSMTLSVDRKELALTASKLLGYALSQDSMMVVSEQQVVGTDPVGAISIDLPEGYGEQEVRALYDRLWELERNGEKLVGGHTTANGHMVILNYSGLPNDELSLIIDQHLDGQFTIRENTVYSAFPDKESYNYGSDQESAPTGRAPAERRANSLRAEATRLLRESIGTGGVFRQATTGRAGGVAPLRTGDLEVAQRYGQPTEGSTSVLGIHYSRDTRSALSGYYYGTGLKGAEKARLDGTPDGRLRNRIHFYVDTGKGIRPEAGVGGNVHAVHLDNLYDVSADPMGLRKISEAITGRDDSGFWFNAVESTILDAGYDGVYVPGAQGTQGVAVLLGDHTVPVEQKGAHNMGGAGAYEPPVSTRMRYSLLSSEIRQFSEQEAAIKKAAPSANLAAGTLTFEEADRAAIESFFPGAVKSARFMQPARGGFDPQQLMTILTEKSDNSTFLHETAHFFLTVYGDMAAQADAPLQVKEDMQTLLNWFGVKDLDTWNGMSLEEQRKYHEQFAYNYEIYLFEGKAPSVKMQTLFDRFSAWLRRVYISIRDDLNETYKQEHGTDLPILTGEVKTVMDRMIASDEQIKQAETVRNMVPMYQNQAESNMNDAEWAAYQAAMQEATDTASAELTNASMRQMKWLANARSRVLKDLQKQTAETRKSVREEVEAEVKDLPIYKAMNWLKNGETVDQDGNEIKAEAGFKLSIDSVKAMYPESGAGLAAAPDYKKLGFGKYGMLAEEGLHPDIVAGMFGFKSGDALVRSLLDAKKIGEEIDARTDERMLNEYGDMTDPKAIEIAVERALHNEARARFVAVELRHLAKAMRPVRLMLEAAKQAARQLISNKPLGTIKPREYSMAEARSAKQAEDLMKKGESQKAIEAKQQQLLSNQLAAEAIKANTEVAKSLEFFKKIFGKDEKLSKSRDMNLVNAARSILANYGLGKSEGPAGVYLEKVKEYDPEFYAEIEPMINAHLQTAKPFDQLTYDEFLDIRDQVSALWELSKNLRTIEIDGKRVNKDEAVKELTDRIGDMDTKQERAGYKKAITDKEKGKIMLMGARAALRRVESWVDAMDAGKPEGPFRKYIWTPISEAVAKYRIAKTDYLEQYLNIIKTVEKGLSAGSISAVEIGYEFKNKAELLHAILHTGNESNKRKLLLGREWASENEDGTMDTRQWDAFLARMYAEKILTKADYDFAQSVWDLLEKMKPDAQKVHKQMYGFYFNEITADAIETPFGVYRGGYVPAVTDPWIVTDAAVRNEQETQATDNSYMFPTTGRGFTKGRVDYNKPLILDLGYLPSHIDKVLRFTFIEPRIKDVAKIVKTDKKFAAAMDQLDQTIRGDMLVPWLQRTAQQMIQMPMKGMGGKLAHKFFSEIRTRTGMQMMVANITNALQQITGISIAALKVKPKYLRDALWTYTRQPTVTTNMISEKSEYMRTRMSSAQFEVSKQIEDMLVDPTKYDKLRDFANKHGYFMQQGMQNLVDTIVWTGAYNQAIEAGVDSDIDAVRQADAAVRQTQGSFAPEDVSRFETGNAFVRAFTMFYSYFNMQANLLGTEFTKTVREYGVKKGAGQLFYTYVFGFMIPAVLSEIIVQAAGGFDDGDDDEYDMYDAMSLFFGSQARTALAMFPLVGSSVTAGFNMWNSKPYDDRISTSASVSALESTVRAPHSVYKAIADDGSWKKAVKDTLTMLGMLTGLPLGQLGKPLGYAADVAQGKTEPQSVGDVVRGAVSGKDVNRKE